MPTGQVAAERVIPVRLAAVVGHERVVDDDVFAARAAESRDVPVVVDGVVAARKHEGARIGDRRAVDFDTARDRAEHDPVTMVASGGKRPAAADAEAALDLLCFTGRRVG